jgi:hypothetical protein
MLPLLYPRKRAAAQRNTTAKSRKGISGLTTTNARAPLEADNSFEL